MVRRKGDETAERVLVTSGGAHYEEASGAESHTEFVQRSGSNMYLQISGFLVDEIYTRYVLRAVAKQLDRWFIKQAEQALAAHLPAPKPCRIRLLGQMALLETGSSLSLANTKDVDVRADYEYSAQKEFERLLQRKGLMLDPVGHEAWMPRETRYLPVFQGRYVTLLAADQDAVLISKAWKAPVKNAPLIREYLSQGASDRFFELAEKYDVDLEQFV